MDNFISTIDHQDPLWIAIAFLCGLLSRAVGLPPLVGFLAAGFVLNYLGAQGGAFLSDISDIGITLLLFTIGLKLRVKELLRPQVWGVTFIHTTTVTLVSALVLLLLMWMNLPLFRELDLGSAVILGFALSFSSTVFVVKVLEGRGDFLSRYGRLAIGVLVVQDILAVVFLGASEAKLPSIWATAVIVLLFVSRPLLMKLLDRIGHGELLVLFGVVLALGGAALFEQVDLKADLGALVLGTLLASNAKAEELAKSLFSIKELFLVGFFLSIGMAGLPTWSVLLAVSILIFGLIAKAGLFFFLFSFFRVRTRSSFSAATALGNYSEFGLIVAAVAVTQGWLATEWLVVMAVLVAVSFAISSAGNARSDLLYTRFKPQLYRFQSQRRLLEDEDIDLADVKVLVCGMGRVGCGAYDYLVRHAEENILGLDFDSKNVKRQVSSGRKTTLGDVSSPDFWGRINLNGSGIEWILLCTPNFQANVQTATLARNSGFTGFISASAKYIDDEPALKAAGVDAVFNIYAEAGAGLAQHGQEMIASLPEKQAATGTNP